MTAGFFSARIRSRFLPAALAAAAALAALPASAQTLVTWTGSGGNTSWSTTGNWTTGGPPTTTGTWGLTITGTNQAVSGTLTMSDDVGGTSSALTLSNLSIASTSNTVYIIQRAGTRTFTLIDGGTIATLNAGGKDRIGVPITLSGSATFNINHTLQLDGGLTGGTAFTKSGGSTLFFQNNFSQNVNLTGGEIYMNAGVASGTITIATSGVGFVAAGGNAPTVFSFLQGGYVRAWGGANAVFTSATFNTPSAAASDVTFSLTTATTLSEIQGVIQDNTSKKLSLLLSSSGANWRLSGSNTYSGGTTISAFVNLTANNASALGTGLVTANGNLNVNGLTLSVNGLVGTSGVIGSATNASVLAVNSTGTSTTFSGTIQNGSGTMGLTALGTGTLTLSGSNTHSGATTVNGGVLRLSNQNAAQNSTVTMGGGSLVFDSSVTGNAFTFGGLSGTASGAGFNLALQNNAGTPAAVALTVGGNNASTAFAGVLSGAGSLTKTGSGTLTLSGSNTYSGVTSINGGTVLFSSTAALYGGTSANWTAANLTTGSGATAAFSVAGSSGFSAANLDTLRGLGTGSTGFLPGSSFGIDTTGTAFTYASNISNPNGGSNALGLSKLGSGTLTLSGSNGYTGVTSLSGGVLALGTSSALAGGGNLTFGGGTLQFSAANTVDYSTRIKNSGSAISIDTNSQTVAFANAIDSTNTGGLTKLGSGTLTLSGSNTYTGGTQINAGLLAMGSALALGGSNSAVTVASGASLDLAGITGTSTNPYALTISGSGVAGAGALTNSGAGATFFGTVTLAGDSTIKVGANGLNLGSATSQNGITGNYALTVTGNNQLDVFGNIQTASVTVNANGTLRLESSNSFAGGLTVKSGEVVVKQQNALGGSGTGTVYLGDTAGSASALVSLANNFTYANPIIVQAGNTGYIEINSYGGYTPVVAGNVTLNNTLSLVNTNGGTGNNLTVSGTILGTGGLVIKASNAANPVTLSGNNTFSGTTTAISGKLVLANQGALTNSTLSMAGGSVVFDSSVSGNAFTFGGLSGTARGAGYDIALQNNAGTPAAIALTVGGNNASTTYAGVLSGAGSLTKAGTGTLTLSASNAFSGGLTIGGTGAVTLGHSNAAGTGTISLVSTGTTYKPTLTVNSGLTVTNPIVMDSTTGWEQIQAGTGSTSLTGGITVTGNGSNPLYLSTGASGTFTVSGGISGTASNIKLSLDGSGSGVGVLNGVVKANLVEKINGGNWVVNTSGNTWNATWIWGTGNLVLGANDALATGAWVNWGGTSVTGALDLNGFNQTIAGIYGPSAANTNNKITNNGATDSVLTLSGLGSNYTFGGVIADGSTKKTSLVMNSAGRSQTLAGVNTYSGATTISAGTLALGSGGSIATSGTVTVGSAGSSGAVLDLTAMSGSYAFGSGQTVKGIGTIAIGTGKTVSSAGIWAPGNSIGSNTVTGNLTLTGTSQFELGTPGTSLASPGTSDFTAVSGTLALGGNLQLIDNANAGGLGSYGAGSYRLFTAPTVSGTFGSVTAPAGATTTRVGLVYTSGTDSGQGVFANVYNLASATSAQTVNLGNAYAGTTAVVSLTNTAPTDATYTETLSTGGFTSTSANFTATGSASGIAGGSSGTGTLLVGLGSGLAAGPQSGTTTLALFSNAVNSSGLAQQSIGSQTLTITGTVWNPAGVNAITVPTIANVRVGGTFASQALTITNTAAAGSFTESLTVSGSTSGLASLAGSVSPLAGGSSSTGYSLGLGDSTNTGSVGVKTGTATLTFTSSGPIGTATIAPQSLVVSSTVFNPAAATTSGSVNLGSVIVGSTSAWTQALSVMNSAPNDGFSESLNASFGSLSGVTTNSGSFNLLAAGDTNTTALTVSLATGSVGNQAGSAQILFATDGQGTSGLGTESLSPQTVNVYGTVLDHALPGFVGAGITDPYAQTTLNLDFGSMDESAGAQTLTYSLTNLASLLYGPGLTAGLDLTAFTPDGGGFSSGLSTFNNLVAGGTSSLFTASFTPSGQGTFSKTFTLSFSDNRNLAGATSVRSLTINTQVIVVPEPGAIALAGVGIAAAAWALRRRK